MCSRFAFAISVKELQSAFPWVSFPEDLPKSYNIAPTQPIPVVTNQNPNTLDFALWGLMAPWEKNLSQARKFINARSETVFEKQTFKNPVKHRRCLVLASGYFEWKKTPQGKQPFYFTQKNGEPFAMGGIYEIWEGIDGSILQTCALLTTEANPEVGKIHNRMPVIIRPELYDRWLDKVQPTPKKLAPCFTPFPSKFMKITPVSTYVNSVGNHGEECISPLTKKELDEEQLAFF